MDGDYRLPLHVEEHGSGEHPLVLLHGFAGSSFTWRYWTPELASSHRVILVDLKGHGSAPAPADGRYSPADQADLVHRLILHEDLTGVTLVGHSMGGAVALLVALRMLDAEDQRLERLALIAGAGLPQPLPTFIRVARGLFGRVFLRWYPKRRLVRRILRAIVHDPSMVSESQVHGYAEPLARPDHQRAVLETASQLVPEDPDAYTARFSEIEVPTLLLWGESDRAVPPWVGERLAELLPNATFEVLEDCGHLPPEERWAESLESFRRFLAEHA